MNLSNAHKYLILSCICLSLLFSSCKWDMPNNNSVLFNQKEDTEQITPIISTPDIGRDVWQKPDLVIRELGDISDKTIVDIGAGTGYFSFRLAFKAAKVIAVEIDTQAISEIENSKLKLPEIYQERLFTRLAKEEDPMLQENEADAVVIINTIAFIKNIPAYLNTLKKGLKDGGIIMIVDYKMKKLPIDAPPKTERVYLDRVEEMLEQVGYSEVRTNDTSLDYQYILTAINNK
jgi:ubiquinone/menaquinone biosynthesis C-methylase UbiE